MNRRVLAATVVIALLAACGGGGSDSATTASPTSSGQAATTLPPTSAPLATTTSTTSTTSTTTAATTSPPTTVPPSPWHEADISALAGLYVDEPFEVLAGNAGLLLVGLTAGEQRLVATTVDGSQWHVTEGLDGVLVDLDGTWAAYRRKVLEDDGLHQAGITELLLQSPDGAWEVAVADVPGLEFDRRVTGSLRYVRESMSQALGLSDGGVIGLGEGGYMKSYDTGDETSWLGRSADGTAWTSETLDHAGGDRIFPRALLDTSSGPVVVGEFVNADGTHLMVWSARDGFDAVFDQLIKPPYLETSPVLPAEETFDIVQVTPIRGAVPPTLLVVGLYKNVLRTRVLAADDAGQWSLTEFPPLSVVDALQIVDATANGDVVTYLANGKVKGSDGGVQTILIHQRGDTFEVEAPVELARTVARQISTLPDGSLFVFADTPSGAVAFVRDAL